MTALDRKLREIESPTASTLHRSPCFVAAVHGILRFLGMRSLQNPFCSETPKSSSSGVERCESDLKQVIVAADEAATKMPIERKSESKARAAEQPASAYTIAKTLYLVRHGEAVHNVLEAESKKKATDQALSDGLEPGSEKFQAYLAKARLEVLNDTKLKDAVLSEKGFAQAAQAGVQLQKLIEGSAHLPTIQRVMVSPLRRTLQTAAAMFPDHHRVTVHEILRERQTGLPCDERSTKRQLKAMRAFSHMCFKDVISEETDDESDDDARKKEHNKMPFDSPLRRARSCPINDTENAAQLRLRTGSLLQLLKIVEEETICIVTHKGYLREFERGPLGLPGSSEFGTAEVRAYHIQLRHDGAVDLTVLHRKDAIRTDGK